MATNFNVLRLKLLSKKQLREQADANETKIVRACIALAADTLVKNDVTIFNNVREFTQAGALIKRELVNQLTDNELRIIRRSMKRKFKTMLPKMLDNEPRYKKLDVYWFDLVLTRVIDSM